MPFQRVPDTAQLRFRAEGVAATDFAGLTWYWSAYVRDASTDWSAARLQTLANFGAAWWDTGKGVAPIALRATVHQSWRLAEVTAQDLDVENGVIASAVPANPTGSRVGDPYTPSSPVILRMNGAAGGLPKRGRVFWSGQTEGDMVGQSVVVAYRGLVADTWAQFRDALDDPAQGGVLTWEFVLVSRNSGTIVDPNPPKIAVRRPVAVVNGVQPSFDVRPIVGSQRNRRTGE